MDKTHIRTSLFVIAKQGYISVLHTTPPKLDVLKRKFFGSLGAAHPQKFNFNFKVLNRRIFTRRIRFFVDHRARSR